MIEHRNPLEAQVEGLEIAPKPDRLEYREIAEVVLLAAVLEKQVAEASYDSLTGLRRRERFEEDAIRYHRRIYTDAQLSENFYMAVIFGDVNKLKTINDEQGHAAGDRYLRTVAESFHSKLRPSDITGRLHGDEFVAAFPVTARLDDLMLTLLGQEIRDSINVSVEGLLGQANAISIGITRWKPDQTLDTALHEADKNMYLDKQTGRSADHKR